MAQIKLFLCKSCAAKLRFILAKEGEKVMAKAISHVLCSDVESPWYKNWWSVPMIPGVALNEQVDNASQRSAFVVLRFTLAAMGNKKNIVKTVKCVQCHNSFTIASIHLQLS